MDLRSVVPAAVGFGRMGWLARFAAALCGVILIAVVLIVAQRWRAEAESRQLLQALALIDLGKSDSTEVDQIEQRFRAYQLPTEQTGTVHRVSFEITNQPIPRLRIGAGSVFSAGIGVKDGKVVSVNVNLLRQVQGGTLSGIVIESLHEQRTLFCKEPYCVGNPIGKPFIVSRLSDRATPEMKARAFDLNLHWLSRFSGEPRICDLAPKAWEDWKIMRPDDTAMLQATYHCL